MTEEQIVKLYRSFFLLGDISSLKILFELDRYGEKRFSELRDNLKINPATLTKKLRLLQSADLIVADKSHDLRSVYYSLHRHQKHTKRILDAIQKLSEEI